MEPKFKYQISKGYTMTFVPKSFKIYQLVGQTISDLADDSLIEGHPHQQYCCLRKYTADINFERR